MRICHVITKPELGGAQITTLNLVLNLPKDKYDISLITSSRGILKQDFKKIADAKVYFLPFLIRAINPIVDILAFIHIYLIYRSNKHDLIHTHSSKAGIIGRWAARFAKIKIIIHTVHGWSFNDYQPLILKRLYIFLEKITARFTAKIICVSENDIKTGLRYKIAPREKFVLIKYGIPLEKFRKKEINKERKRKELGIRNNGPVVGMISCLKPQKSPEDYVRAAIKIYDAMPGVNFLLAGNGILRNRCKNILKHSGIDGRFIFAGWRKDISEILDILDVFVLTSKWEGMSVAMIEALSKGKPAVVTDAGGAIELVKDGVSGYVTKPGAYEETAGRVVTMLKDKSLLSSMGREAELSIDESFDIKNMARNVDRLYQECFAGGAR